MVEDGDDVGPGDVLAKIPKESTRTKDITGGCRAWWNSSRPASRARRLSSAKSTRGAVWRISKGQRKIYVTADNGDEKEYSVPRGIHVNVQEGERLSAGDPLMDGPLNPHDILAVLGEKALQAYLVNEIQEVYRLQGVAISDKHIEVIVRQMLRWSGSTKWATPTSCSNSRWTASLPRGERAGAGHWRPSAIGRPLLLGITKASLSTTAYLRGQLPGDDARAH